MEESKQQNEQRRGYNQGQFKKEIKPIYSRCQITKTVALPIKVVDNLLRQTLKTKISGMIEGRCIVEGYVKPGTVEVMAYSSGLITGQNITFNVIIQCFVSYPVAGSKIKGVAKTISKGGVRAESADETPSPVVIFISRDQFNTDDYFNSIKEGDIIEVRVIENTFELNDQFVSVIGELVKPNEYIGQVRIEY